MILSNLSLNMKWIRILQANQNSWNKYETKMLISDYWCFADYWCFLTSLVGIVQNSSKFQAEFIKNSFRKKQLNSDCVKKGHWKRSCQNEPGKIGSRDFISKGSTSSSTPDNKSANCPRIFKSITSSSHVFTDPQLTKSDFFSMKFFISFHLF